MDIVERLRGRHDIHYAEAADEIETMRQHRDELAAALRAIVDDNDFCKDNWGDRSSAWIETARAALAKMEK